MMVSSACLSSCTTTLTSKGNYRMLNIDFNKDYGKSLLVETSVEYDLPSHIYPPKGSEPILMIHPSYATAVRAKRSHSTTSSPTVSSSTSRPLSALQLHSSQQIRNISKPSLSRIFCICGNPNCTSVFSSQRIPSVKNSLQQTNNVLSGRQITQIPENVLYSTVKNIQLSTDMKNHQKQLQQQKTQMQKQIQAQQKQLQQQHLQQVQLQQQINERAKLQAQQLQQLQAQQQKSLKISQQPVSSEQLLSWSVGSTKCQGPCCQLRGLGQPVPSSQSEFLAPGLPPSLLSRTPTRGPAGGSPKLRARSRRGLSVANTVNLPDYLGSSRSSRTTSVGSVAGSSHNRTRSASILAAAPAPISAHQVASALDIVRALTPRSLLTNTQQHLTTTSNTSTLLSTVGQSRDSGCSLSAENSIMVNSSNNNISNNTINNGNNTNNNNNNSSVDNSKNIEWMWSVVDSGFCTPVDTTEDQFMETLNSSIQGTVMSTSNVTSVPSLKESSVPTFSWMKNFTAPLTPSLSANSGGLHNPFLPPSNPPYIPQPIWNLAY